MMSNAALSFLSDFIKLLQTIRFVFKYAQICEASSIKPLLGRASTRVIEKNETWVLKTDRLQNLWNPKLSIVFQTRDKCRNGLYNLYYDSDKHDLLTQTTY